MEVFISLVAGPQNSTDPRPLGEIIAELAKGDSPLAKVLAEMLEAKSINRTPLEDWIPGSVVEDLINVSTRTLQQWRSQGIIGYTVVGNKCLYRRSEIEALMDNRYRKEDRHDR